MNSQCLNCGSDDLVEGVHVTDWGDGNMRYALTLETFDNPDAFLFKGAHRAELSARVCASCGFVMMFAQPRDVEELRKGQTL